MIYDSIIIGGGIAGLQAAIQLGRYEHRVLVIDKGYGRSTLCRSYHNLLGWPNGISGLELRRLGRMHAEMLGIQFAEAEVTEAIKENGIFYLKSQDGQEWQAKTILFATGLIDRFPDLPGIVPCLGLSIYVCPDCDGYEVKERKTVIIGSGDAGAGMAAAISYWTDDITFINHEAAPISERLMKKMDEYGVKILNKPVQMVEQQDGIMQAVKLADGTVLPFEKGFIAFGNNDVKSHVASQLGVERLENGHIVIDPRTRMTNITNVWAAGDVALYSEQVAIAMGEGMQAAIWMHKALRKMAKLQKEPAFV